MYVKSISWRVALGVLLALAVRANADIDMVLRPDRPIARIGDEVEVGLYLVPDDGLPRDVVGFEVILGWDPLALELLGAVVESGNWWGADFPEDDALDRLNADCDVDTFCAVYTGHPFNDGDALYTAFGPVGNTMPGGGLRVVTYRFRALAVSFDTEVTILTDVGGESRSRVLDGDSSNLGAVITGALYGGMLDVATCGTRGDFDGDCLLRLVDHGGMAACVQGPAETTLIGPCAIADLDRSGTIDLRDVQWFQLLFDGP